MRLGDSESILRTWGGKATVSFEDKACQEAYRYHGYFTLVSNREKDCFECLSIYRKKETIESFFEAGKQHADGSRTRVWSPDTLRGRMFVQFVSLCYYAYFSEQLREIKLTLGRQNKNRIRIKKAVNLEGKLLRWMESTPVYLQ